MYYFFKAFEKYKKKLNVRFFNKVNDLEIKISPNESVVPYGGTIYLEVNVKVKNRPNGDHIFSYQWFKKTDNNYEAVKSK
jgi:hypothetical protein